MLLGGIGSGKTTELWRIYKRLQELGGDGKDVPFYVDVAAETGLDGLPRGALVALAGKRLGEREAELRAQGTAPSANVERAVKAIRDLALGDWIGSAVDRQSLDTGLIGHPEDAEVNYVLDMEPSLRALRHAIVGDHAHCTVLFDSLDRVSNMQRLEDALRDDVRVLKRAGIGVVVVGPMRVSYEPHPLIMDLFDQNVHHLADVKPEGTGLRFLVEVLSRRAPPDVIPPEACIEVARFSGGVLRDLIAIAKSAAQEAYVDGSDFVRLPHIAKAAEQFGRVRAVGLDGEQIQALKKIRETGTLVIRGERELALLETRRVLDYGNGQFVVHPTLAPLLDLITVAA